MQATSAIATVFLAGAAVGRPSFTCWGSEMNTIVRNVRVRDRNTQQSALIELDVEIDPEAVAHQLAAEGLRQQVGQGHGRRQRDHRAAPRQERGRVMIRAGIVLIIAVVAVNAVAYAHAVRGTAGDGSISWAIRHPFVMFDLDLLRKSGELF